MELSSHNSKIFSHRALIACHYHEKIFHLGRRSTLRAIRESGYWLVSGPTTVKRIINNCVGCKRLRGECGEQLMGDLPSERLKKAAPFTHTGADALCLFYVKDRRSEVKRWGLMLTCLCSRAVHIELLEDMTTHWLLHSLRCFMALRGPIKSMTINDGTNSVGLIRVEQQKGWIGLLERY